ncbi:MAG: glycoside hydrolase family 28 protein [Duncaniella sp.]|uniref:glycoside hydrolase family 28 protein n=1 Tax=Duncaniella sp. TaxID=2518496 RepID=UPI0023D3725F|nr:glycoside hydrolase family 28 protein [Duncaniella sp.]MDE5989297.1 glycoside hydrolase family 28 protein [Duncaniella sp.]
MKLKSLSAYAVGLALALGQMTSATAQTTDYSSYYKNLPIKQPQVTAPVIPAYEVKITDFGGVNDGVTLNTEAFAKAMAHLASKGGGRLIVPEGIWYTGPINFESNVELHLDRGALVLFSENLADYPVVASDWEGLTTHRAASPLSARDKHDIAITGDGTFNGNGQKWRPVKKGKMTDNQWKALQKSGCINAKGDVWFPNERIREVYENKELQAKVHHGDKETVDYAHDFLRPVLLSFINCKNVLLKDATFENSPAWNIHPLLCENLIVDNLNVRNPWYAQNGDGIDIESCNKVLVINSRFDVGDDAICIKSGKDKDGRERGIPCRDVVIEGCTVYHGHGGFVIGSEMSGGCKDIVIRNSVFIGTDVGLRFKSTRGRGGVVENIYVDNIKMTDIAGEALIFDMYYGIKPGAPVPPVTEETPSFRNIYIKDVTCRSAKRAALFNGLPEMPMKNVVITDSRFRADAGFMLNHVDGLTLKNVTVDVPGEKITEGEGVKNVNLKK